MNSSPHKLRRFLLIGIGGVSTLLILMGATQTNYQTPTSANDEVVSWTVGSTAFDIYLTEHAEFEALESAVLFSRLPSNKAKVVYLIPAGSLVAPGDVVAKFDPSSFVDDLEKVGADLADAHALQEKAETELALKQQELATKTQDLVYLLKLAQLEYQRLVEVKIPFQREAAALELVDTQNHREQTRKSLATTLKLYEHGYASGEEQHSAIETNNVASEKVRLAEARLALLENVEFPAETSQSRMKTEQISAQALALAADTPKEIRLKQALVNRAQVKVQKLLTRQRQTQSYLDATNVVTPVSGFVRYPELMFGKDTRKVQVGDSVWRQQPFVVIPDLASLIAKVEVREVDVGAVQVGQAAQMWPYAFAEHALTGNVISVGAMRKDSVDPNIRRFEVRIAINDKDDRLRPGMTGKVRVHTHHYEQTPVVPVEAIHYLQGHPTAFRATDGHWTAVPLVLGGNNGAQVAVLDGLLSGETVALNQPALLAATP